MRAVFFSDLHAHGWNEFSEPVEYRGEMLNSRLVDAVKVIDHVRRYCKKRGIKRVYFGGDLFHRKRLIDVPVFNTTAAALRRLARVAHVYLLAGNHDLVKRSALGSFTSEHALRSLAGYRKITVVDQPIVTDDGVGMVPYAGDRDTILRGIEMIHKHAHCYLLHIGANGAKTGPIEFQPLEPISEEDLPDDRMIYSGHYHAPQTLPGGLRYIGAPLELVRGDSARGRGFLSVDLNKPTEATRVRHKGPRFVQATARGTRVEWRGFDKGADKGVGNFVDVVVKDSNGFDAEKLTKDFYKCGFRGVNIIYAEEPKHKKARLKTKSKGIPTVQELCDAYVLEHGGPSLGSKRLLQIAREALEEAEVERAS